MSQNTGCDGTITIPKALFSKTCKSILEEYNELYKKDVEKFNNFLDTFLLEQKGKRNLDWYNTMVNAIEGNFPESRASSLPKHHFVVIDVFSTIYSLCKERDPETGKMINKKPVKLKPKKMKLAGEENFVSLPFATEASFTINKEKASIDVFVSYNNHNLEYAESNPFFRSTISKLKEIKYTKNTGGTIYSVMEADYAVAHEHDTSSPMLMFGCDAVAAQKEREKALKRMKTVKR